MRCKYIEGIILTNKQIISKSFLQSVKRNRETYHIKYHSFIICCFITINIITIKHIKIETVYFMLKRSLPWIFEEIMVFAEIEYFKCQSHDKCIDIGEKHHSVAEAKRIVSVFHHQNTNNTYYQNTIILSIRSPSLFLSIY